MGYHGNILLKTNGGGGGWWAGEAGIESLIYWGRRTRRGRDRDRKSNFVTCSA